MFDFTSLLFPLILTWMLTFTDAQTSREETVRVGDEATLKCENAKDFSDGCSRITWIYSHPTKPTSPLFEHGKIHKDVGSKSDRLNVTEKCSLVIKKITDEDAGTYICRQFNKSGQMETDFQLKLTVKKDVRSKSKTPKPTSKPSSASTSAAKSTTTTGSVLSTFKPSTTTDHVSKSDMTAGIITAAVIVAACILVVVMLMGWRRIKERKTQIEANMTPPEDADSYASISFSRNTNNRRQVLDKDDGGDAVIYSTVKVSSSSGHDPISLH